MFITIYNLNMLPTFELQPPKKIIPPKSLQQTVLDFLLKIVQRFFVGINLGLLRV